MSDKAPKAYKTRLTRRIYKKIKRVLVRIAVWTVPYIYLAYMWFVYKTSRVEELGCRPSMAREHCGKGVYAIWHDEVFFVAWAFGKYRPHTLASLGDAGELIARMLELCGFQVFRGGSSKAKSRRAHQVVRDMITCMNEEQGVLYGVTTDGSKGPVYRMKKGVVTIASSCEAPVLIEKTWAKRKLQLPTWDRSLVPLPFNKILHVYIGPFYPPAEVKEDKEAFEDFRADIERRLTELSGWVRFKAEGKKPPAEWVALFPEQHQAAVAAAAEPPRLFYPYDRDENRRVLEEEARARQGLS